MSSLAAKSQTTPAKETSSSTKPKSSKKPQDKSTDGGGNVSVKKLWPKLQTKNLSVNPRSLHKREINARYMEPTQFDRLVQNVLIDGKLTSTVLCFKTEKGDLEILSGHHRCAAAIKAGLDEIDVEVILTQLSDERKVAIQLSHNSITGQDNPSILTKMYENLDLSAKKFSGLTDESLGNFGKLSLEGLGAATIRYEQLLFLFLPEDLELFEETLKQFEKRAQAPHIHIAPMEAFEAFFDAVVRTKNEQSVFNSAVALTVMAQLAMERLDQLEEENEQDKKES